MNRLAKIIGQEEVIRRLGAFVDLHLKRGNPPEHILLIGPEGTGKRTIAAALAEELHCSLKTASPEALIRRGDLSAVLTSLENGDFLFMENIPKLREPLKAMLLRALVDFRIDLVIGQGAAARIHPYRLSYFTCIATATREVDRASELRDAFPLILTLRNYSRPELEQIVQVIARVRSLEITPTVCTWIVDACDRNPHEIEVLIQRLSRAGAGRITDKDAAEILTVYGFNPSQYLEVTSTAGLRQLNGVQFEKLVSALLQKMGFEAKTTKASGDGGIDIVAILDKPVIGGRYLIQCKRLAQDTLVGVPTVREFYGAITADRGAVKGILVTTSAFTAQAKEFAGEVGIELIDGARLNVLLGDCGLAEEPRSTKKSLF
jgi:Holliday junction resolvasome RuvABC ATP-dependent DNA helicase subunit